MRSWALASAGLAPVALIGGWTLAAARQPADFDSVRDTISALAARGATDPGLMTAGLAGLGLCHLLTAAGLSELERPARALLALGGAATLAVAALPQPNPGHVPAATVGFLALAAWPAFTRVAGRRTGRGASLVLTALLCWLAVELDRGQVLGLSERLLAGTQALVPLGAVLAALVRQRRGAVLVP